MSGGLETEFRSAYLATLPERVLDLALHATVACFLPGPWWFQALPDMLLPVLWVKAMATDKFDPEWSLLLRGHRFLHGRGTFRAVALVLMVAGAAFSPSLAAQWMAHVAIDSITHGKGWQ